MRYLQVYTFPTMKSVYSLQVSACSLLAQCPTNQVWNVISFFMVLSQVLKCSSLLAFSEDPKDCYGISYVFVKINLLSNKILHCTALLFAGVNLFHWGYLPKPTWKVICFERGFWLSKSFSFMFKYWLVKN